MESTPKTHSLTQLATRGAGRGVTAWVAYAIVEHLFLIVARGLIAPAYVLPSWYWGLSLLVFGVYAAAGASLGLAAAVAVHWIAPRVRRFGRRSGEALLETAVVLSVPVAVALRMAVHLPTSGLTVLSFVLLAISAAAALKLWRGRLVFLANPWAVAWLQAPLFLIKLAAVTSRFWTVVTFLAGLGTVLSIALMIRALARRRRAVLQSSSPVRAPVWTATAAALLVAAGGLVDQRIWNRDEEPPARPARSGLPNIVWIVMDTVRADHLSVYGYERDTTPYLKKLSEEAALYRRAIAAADYTLASHASMFTGLFPSWHGAHHGKGSRRLREEFRTLAEMLSALGYKTVGISANYGHLEPSFRVNQGFQHWESFAVLPFQRQQWYFSLRGALRPWLRRIAPLLNLEWMKADGGYITARVTASLDSLRQRTRPFFLFVNYMDAHHPYLPPPPYDTLYAGVDPSFEWRAFDTIKSEIAAGRRKVTEAERRHLIAQYDGTIRYLDSQIGVVLRRLKESGLFEDSLIIVTSDHGESFGSKGVLGHFGGVHQNLVHVPLIIKLPRDRRARVVDELVSGVDLMPTVLDVLKEKIPDGLHGTSLLRLSGDEPREVIAEHLSGRRSFRAFFDGRMKLLAFADGGRELYDLSRDPKEQNDLYRSRPREAERLEAEFRRWVQRIPKGSGQPAMLERETLRRLRSLGYLQ